MKFDAGIFFYPGGIFFDNQVNGFTERTALLFLLIFLADLLKVRNLRENKTFHVHPVIKCHFEALFEGFNIEPFSTVLQGILPVTTPQFLNKLIYFFP